MLPPTKLLPQPSTLTDLNRLGLALNQQFFLCYRGAMLRNRLHQSPCNGDPPMTPNQLRLRASSHKDFSTANSSGFTPDSESFRDSSTYNSLNLTNHPCSEHKVGDSQPVGLGHKALKTFAVYPSDRARVSRQSVATFFLFLFFIYFYIGRLH